MKKLSYILIAAFIVLVAACDNPENNTASKETITVSHHKGTTGVPREVKRVVCLDYSILETLDYLRIPVIGIPKGNITTALKKYGENEEITDVGTLKEANFEKINALRPDVIFISDRMESAYDELSKIAPTIYLSVDQHNFISSLKQQWDIIGTIFGKEQEIDQAYESILAKAAAVHAKAGTKNLKGLITLFNKGKFSAYGAGSRYGIIHNLLGVPPAADHIEDARHGQVISNEFIQKTNPDILFVIDRNAAINRKASDRADIENALVQQTNAYKNGKIIYLDAEIWYLAGSGIMSVNAMIDDINKALD